MPVVDASVVVAMNHRQEVDYAACRDWYRRALQDDEAIVAPAILLGEVAAALSRDLNTLQLATAFVEGLVEHKAIEVVAVTSQLGLEAGRLAVSLGLRGCDAVYVALAKQLGMPIVTLDQQQLDRASKVVTVLRPSQ